MFHIYIMAMDSICLHKILLFYDVNGASLGLMLRSKLGHNSHIKGNTNNGFVISHMYNYMYTRSQEYGKVTFIKKFHLKLSYFGAFCHLKCGFCNYSFIFMVYKKYSIVIDNLSSFHFDDSE